MDKIREKKRLSQRDHPDCKKGNPIFWDQEALCDSLTEWPVNLLIPGFMRLLHGS